MQMSTTVCSLRQIAYVGIYPRVWAELLKSTGGQLFT